MSSGSFCWLRRKAEPREYSDMEVKDLKKIAVVRANRRSFDCASCDETARGSAQDDISIIESRYMEAAIGAAGSWHWMAGAADFLVARVLLWVGLAATGAGFIS